MRHDSWIAGNIQGLNDIFSTSICLQAHKQFMREIQVDKAYEECSYNPKAKVPSCWSKVHEPTVQFLTEKRYAMLLLSGEPTIIIKYINSSINFQPDDTHAGEGQHSLISHS